MVELVRDNHRVIVLGAHPRGNVGDAICSEMEERHEHWNVEDPSQDILDVTRPDLMAAYDWQANALVYCPGLCLPDYLHDQTWAQIKSQIDVTLTGALHASSLFVKANLDEMTDPSIRKRIVIIGSRAAETPHRCQAPYNAAKAGLRMMVETLSREYHPMGFRFFLVEPGAISGTPYSDRVREAAARIFGRESSAKMGDRGTFGRNVEPFEVADLVTTIVSGRYDWLAGAPIPFSGGPQ